MIFGLVHTSEQHYPELCIVADKPSELYKPIPIRLLRPTDCGVQLISNEEGIRVELDPSDNGIIITTIRPCKLYITPNLPEKPGMSVERIKAIPFEDGNYKVLYAKATIGGAGSEKDWEEWNPNTKLF